MTITGYLTDHWGMLVLLIGLSIMLFSDMHLERRMVQRMSVVIIMLFLYSISCYVEAYLGNLVDRTPVRAFLAALNYSLVTFILLNVIMIMYPQQKALLYIPAILNALLCFISLPTGLVFWISDANHFTRGPLGYMTYVINALYLAYFYILLFKKDRVQKEDYPVLIFFSINTTLCLVLPLFMENMTSHWFTVTIAIDILLYYVFLLQQFTKRDPLTKLLNRQSYYSDAEKFLHEITAFIALDMDGLKNINDTKGHKAGDIALRALADCFWNAADQDQRVYRIGGDEYVILCLGSTEPEVHELIGRIKKQVAATPYTCSVGYAMKTEGSTIDTLYQLADANLYEEKKLFYERAGKLGRKR